MAVLIVGGMNSSLIVSQKKPSERDLEADKKARVSPTVIIKTYYCDYSLFATQLHINTYYIEC